MHECVQCRAIVCEQDSLDGKGCIAFATVSKLVPFLCPFCERAEWKKSPRPKPNPAVSEYIFIKCAETDNSSTVS